DTVHRLAHVVGVPTVSRRAFRSSSVETAQSGGCLRYSYAPPAPYRPSDPTAKTSFFWKGYPVYSCPKNALCRESDERVMLVAAAAVRSRHAACWPERRRRAGLRLSEEDVHAHPFGGTLWLTTAQQKALGLLP